MPGPPFCPAAPLVVVADRVVEVVAGAPVEDVTARVVEVVRGPLADVVEPPLEGVVVWVGAVTVDVEVAPAEA